MPGTYGEEYAQMSEKPTLTGRSWLLPIAVLIAAAAVIAVMLWPQNDDDAYSGDGGDQQAAVDVVDPEEYDDPEQMDLTEIESRDADDPLGIGDTDAPVVLVVFSDYQCPYCASWSEETLPVMMDYVDRGELRIEMRDLNVFGPESVQASHAAYAAALQDRFWDFHHELFAGGETRSESELSEESLTELADDLGLDTEQFTEDMNSADVEEQVSANQQLGTDIGAYSTPSFVLGGQPMVGAQPTEVFTDAVDEALAEAE